MEEASIGLAKVLANVELFSFTATLLKIPLFDSAKSYLGTLSCSELTLTLVVANGGLFL